MLRMTFLLFTVLGAGSSSAPAQELQSPLQRIRHDFAAQKLKAQAAYDKAMKSARKDAVRSAEEFAKTAARKGDLPTASEGWKLVLTLDPNHEAAKKFFRTLGTLDKTTSEIHGKPETPERVLLAGRWIRDFRNAPFILAADGNMHMLEADGSKSDAWNGKWIVDSGVAYFLYNNGSYHAFEVKNAGLMAGIGKSKGQKLTKAK